jgi:hypothetical protein
MKYNSPKLLPWLEGINFKGSQRFFKHVTILSHFTLVNLWVSNEPGLNLESPMDCLRTTLSKCENLSIANQSYFFCVLLIFILKCQKSGWNCSVFLFSSSLLQRFIILLEHDGQIKNLWKPDKGTHNQRRQFPECLQGGGWILSTVVHLYFVTYFHYFNYLNKKSDQIFYWVNENIRRGLAIPFQGIFLILDSFLRVSHT